MLNTYRALQTGAEYISNNEPHECRTSRTHTHTSVAEMEAEKAKTLVQESWALVQADLDTHGIKFFKKIFEIAPGALELFKSFKGTRICLLCHH